MMKKGKKKYTIIFSYFKINIKMQSFFLWSHYTSDSTSCYLTLATHGSGCHTVCMGPQAQLEILRHLQDHQQDWEMETRRENTRESLLGQLKWHQLQAGSSPHCLMLSVHRYWSDIRRELELITDPQLITWIFLKHEHISISPPKHLPSVCCVCRKVWTEH